MKKLMKVAMTLAALIFSSQMASAADLTVNGQPVRVNEAELCKNAKSGTTSVSLAGVSVRLWISDDSQLMLGNLPLQSCKGKKSNKIGGGGVATSGSFTEDTSPTTRPEPIGDGAGSPVGDGDGVSTPDTDVGEAPSPAGDGEPATENGNERPTQGGDVDGFGDDNSPTRDAPDPAGG